MPVEGAVTPGHAPEVWRVVNPGRTTALGHHPGYEVILGHGATSLLDPEDFPQRRAAFLSTIPLGRFSTPADLAQAAVYLCSDEASLVTGVALEIDGGRCI